jgi:hypothetical protein
MNFYTIFILTFICLNILFKSINGWNESPRHKLSDQLISELEICRDNPIYCENNYMNLMNLTVKIANDHSSLLLIHEAQVLFEECYFYISINSKLGKKISHILAVLAFSQGDLIEAEKNWKYLDSNDLNQQRSLVAQVLLGGSESTGINLMLNYTSLLGNRLSSIIANKNEDINIKISRSSSTEQSEEVMLGLILSEAQGRVRIPAYLSDISLSASDIRSLDARQRFRLGVGLAKLGLYDLSLRHVSLSATPWESPLYRLRAKLVFSQVHSSVRALAMDVDSFVRQGESILLQNTPKSPMMIPICNSFNEAALALQALPLLHLAGFSAPRHYLEIGHAPVALPVLLSEVFVSICPILPIDESLNNQLKLSLGEGIIQKESNISLLDDDDDMNDDVNDINIIKNKEAIKNRKKNVNKIVIGIVSGSLDGVAGRLIIGILEELTEASRKEFELVAMCFPTPRDERTDRANKMFDKHINLSPHNKSQAILRILETSPDFLLFADAALDSRVFALSHERLALYQGAFWGWGGTLGINTIDYYFIPEILWKESKCPHMKGGWQLPQELFSEQVILLDGYPSLKKQPQVSQKVLWEILKTEYLLPANNFSHIYLFPGSVKHVHPEFDAAITLLLKTDPYAWIIIAVPRTGRDFLPAIHGAARHDVMHPTMTLAAVAKFRNRMKGAIGEMVK